MKKLVSVTLVVLMIFALATATFSALDSPITRGKFVISVGTEGSGTASGDKNSVDISEPDENGYVTLTATDGDGFFTKWIITGTYEVISGDEYSAVFVIKPTSDISAIASFSADKDYLTMSVETVGNGEVTVNPEKVKKGSNETVTLTAIEKDAPFVKWVLACDYEIVEGSLTSKTLVIRPFTDVKITAVFGEENKDFGGDNAKGANTGSTSPATGDASVMLIAIVLMALGCGMFAVKKIKE